ncbi:MAG: ankyrin repeat domain-containing protein [Candidatus Anstonellales archaeon]
MRLINLFSRKSGIALEEDIKNAFTKARMFIEHRLGLPTKDAKLVKMVSKALRDSNENNSAWALLKVRNRENREKRSDGIKEHLDCRLVACSWSGDIKACIQLLVDGADPNARSHRGETALMNMARHGRRKGTRLMLLAGADVAMADNYGNTALSYAAEKGYKDTVKLLLEKMKQKIDDEQGNQESYEKTLKKMRDIAKMAFEVAKGNDTKVEIAEFIIATESIAQTKTG